MGTENATVTVTPEAPVVEAPPVEEKTEKKKAPVGTRMSTYAYAPQDLVIIGLDTEDGPEHPLYDPRIKLPLDKHMVANVEAWGIKENVLITKSDAKHPGRPVVVAGRQRVRWARAANENITKRAQGEALHQVLTNLEKGDENELAGIMVLENEIRKDDDMITKARKAQKLMTVNKFSAAQVANVFGVSVPSLRVWLKVLQTSPKVQAAVDAKKITASAALALMELPMDKQDEALAGLIAAAEAGPAPEVGSEDGETAPTKPKKGKKIKITAKDVAAAASKTAKAGGGTAPKATDQANTRSTPNRSSLRRALKFSLEQKGTYARIAGATIAWVLGDSDVRKQEMEEIAEETRAALREVFKAATKKPKITPKK